MTTPAANNAIASNATPWLAEVIVTNPDGTALDLSNYDGFIMHVKADEFDPEPQLVPTVTLVAGGSHNVLRIEHEYDDDLAALWGTYVYDIVATISGAPADKIMEGRIDVVQGITVAGA